LGILFRPNETQTFEMIPLSADLTLEHVRLAFVRFLADAEDTTL
jgi:hypothetical protein